MKIKAWLKAALVRAVRTFAQSFGSMITVGAALAEFDWVYIFSVAAVAAIYSLATSLAGLPEVSENLPGGNEDAGNEVDGLNESVGAKTGGDYDEEI